MTLLMNDVTHSACSVILPYVFRVFNRCGLTVQSVRWWCSICAVLLFILMRHIHVQKAILSGIREVNVSGRSKSYCSGKLQKYRKMKKELSKRLGRNPSVGELSIELGWRINTILSYERQIYDIISTENIIC